MVKTVHHWVGRYLTLGLTASPEMDAASRSPGAFTAASAWLLRFTLWRQVFDMPADVSALAKALVREMQEAGMGVPIE